MKPYYQDDSCTIYHGDCREILPSLRADSVDLVLTDPPYGDNYVTSWRSHDDPLRTPVRGDESLNTLRDALPLLDRLLAPNSHALVFSGSLRIGELKDEVEAFWKIKNVLVWDKGEAGTVGDLESGYGLNWEALLYASKGRRVLNGPRPRSILRYPWSSTRDPVHPTVKPVGLLQTLIARHSSLGDVVLDSFAGSGPVGLAAKNLGRCAVLIEAEERYCEIAARRLQQEVLPLEIS